MKQIKRLTALLIVAAVLILMPMNAMAAAKKEYVPTKAIVYRLSSGSWQVLGEENYSYTKNGRIKSYTFKSSTSPHTSTEKYAWKGNYLKAEDADHYVITYSYKNKRLKSSARTDKSSNSTKTISISWKKRKGTISSNTGVPGSIGSITVNKKNQMIKMTQTINSHGDVSTTTLKYYKNGNFKSLVHVYPGYSYTVKYHKKGYLLSMVSTNSGKVAFKYKKNKKGQITEQQITETTIDGDVNNFRRVYSGWKKLSRPIRNCDAFGSPVPTPYAYED